MNVDIGEFLFTTIIIFLGIKIFFILLENYFKNKFSK